MDDNIKFVNTVKNMYIPDRLIFLLDTSSLYKNIPPLESVKFLCKHIREYEIEIYFPVNKLKEFAVKTHLESVIFV